LLIADPENTDEHLTNLLLSENQDQIDPSDPPDNMPAQISFNALLGHSISQTLRVLGRINSSSITVLVDSGSTHNFIQDRKAKFLGLKVISAQGFHVLVGNSDELSCSAVCKQVPLHLGKHKFLVDLFVLPLSGAELVLGVQWLTTLGPILTESLFSSWIITKNFSFLVILHRHSNLYNSLDYCSRNI